MQSLIITNSGEELISKLIAGTATTRFTKVSASDHDYSGVDLKTLTELENVKQTVLISGIMRIDTTLVEIVAAMDNTELETGYYTRALGVYAEVEDGSEILFAVSIEPDAPSYLPPFSGRTVSSISYRLNIKVNNSEQVEIEVNPGAYPTIEQFNGLQEALNTHTHTALDISDMPSSLPADGGNADTVGGAAVMTTAALGLHRMASGTAAANSTNCPPGCWYGQYE